jgi:adenylate cyclase
MVRASKPTLQSLVKTVLLTSLAVTVPIVGLRELGGLEEAELAAYDDFIQRRPAEKPDDRIVIVTISDDDIERLQQYPLHDATFATALEKLESYRPRAIGLDIARDVLQGPPAGRVRLQQVMAKSETIISGCLLSNKSYGGSPPAPGTPKDGVAFADIPADVDKTTRRVILLSTPTQPDRAPRAQHFCNDARSENEIPSLSFQAALSYLQGLDINPEPNAKGEVQLQKAVLKRIDSQFGGYVHADTPDYQMMLNYRGAKEIFREIPITTVLAGKVDPKLVRDRVVLVGSTSRVSKDDLSTPYRDTQSDSRQLPGVVVHAHAVSQILSAVLDQRPLIQSWPEIVKVLWIWGWSLGGGLLAFYSRRLGLTLLVLVGVGGGLWGICYSLFLYQGLWVPLVPTLIGAIATILGVRMVDLGQRSGYAQAIAEQLRDSLSRSRGRDRQGDYLENLVLRARSLRQGQDAAALLTLDSTPTSFDTPEMQALYEKVAARARADVTAEQAARQVVLTSDRPGSKVSRIQALLNRAQRTRHQNANSSTDVSP